MEAYLQSLRDDAPRYFGNTFSRSWLEANLYWMSPAIAQAIVEALTDSPLGSDAAYFEQMGASGP